MFSLQMPASLSQMLCSPMLTKISCEGVGERTWLENGQKRNLLFLSDFQKEKKGHWYSGMKSRAGFAVCLVSCTYMKQFRTLCVLYQVHLHGTGCPGSCVFPVAFNKHGFFFFLNENCIFFDPALNHFHGATAVISGVHKCFTKH